MGGNDERRDALRLVEGLESGRLAPADAVVLAENLDPVLVYVLVGFLRQVHPASDPAASSVLERVVRLTSSSAQLVRKYKEGERDPVSRWFESEYAYTDFRGRAAELVALVVDKLES